MALRLQQVAQLEHHRARLVEDRQVEHTGFRTPLAGGVEPPQLALDRVRNGLEKTVAHREHQVDVAEVVGREHGVDAAVDRLHFVAHADQVGRLFAGQPFVVVVDMAVCGAHDVGERLGQFVEVVDHLHVVLRRVEIALAQHPQRRHHAVFAFVHPLVEFRRFAVEVAQHLAVLLEDGQQRAVVDAGGGVDRRADHRGDLFDDVFVRDGGRRFGALRLFDEVAVDEHVARQHRQQDQHDGSSVDERQSDDVGDDEAAQRRHEPSRHDGHHARNTVNGRFASPGAVGQRRTHRHHEGDVGGRQRQFERCGHGDQQCRSGEVDRGADHVERCAGVLDVRHFEAAGDRLAEPLGNDPLDGVVGVERRADDGAGEG